MTDVEEIKSKLDIIEIVQDYIPLKKRGASYFAVCPFHHEKTPSFHVSKERQFYKCFGCGEGGDVFDFVQKMEGLEFPDALRLLAEKAGVKIEKFDPQIYTQKNRLLDLLDLAARFYREILARSPQGEEARAYLNKRGLKGATVDLFCLGFAPNAWDTLLNFLVSKNYTAQEAFTAGLLVKRERGDGYYDRFRNRITFPIRDIHGHVVGFTARLMPSAEADPNAGGKYINTPQTEFYNKSRVLYGLDMAKREIKNQDMAVLVEGNMDVITCHEYGMKNVVAASGTALTIEQIALLRRFSENVALSFDTDKAGELAAEKGIGLLLSAGMNVRVIRLPSGAGKDPDEAIRKNFDVWKRAVAEAMPVMKYLFAAAERKFGLSGGEERKQFAKMLIPYIAKISDAIEQKFWMNELAAVVGISEELLREAYLEPAVRAAEKKDASPESKDFLAAGPPKNAQGTRLDTLSLRMLSLSLMSPQNFQFVVDRITPQMLGGETMRRLYEAMIVLYNSTGALLYTDLEKKIENEGNFELAGALQRVAINGEEDFGELSPDIAQKELLLILRGINEWFLTDERKRLASELALAERGGDTEKVNQICLKIQELLKSGGEHLKT